MLERQPQVFSLYHLCKVTSKAVFFQKCHLPLEANQKQFFPWDFDFSSSNNFWCFPKTWTEPKHDQIIIITCNEMPFRSRLIVRNLVLIWRAFARSLAPTSPIWFPLMSKVWRLWFDPKALMTLLISDFNLQSDKLSLLTEASSEVMRPTMDSMTDPMYLALTLVMFLLAFKDMRLLFLERPCITPAISASKLFSLRSSLDKHLTVPMQFSRTLAPFAPRLLLLRFSSTFVVDSLQANPVKWAKYIPIMLFKLNIFS